MKKILGLALAILMSTSVFGQQLIDYNTEATVPLYAKVDSRYMVYIPEQITVDGSEYRFTAEMMDLCPDEQVEIRILGTDEFGTVNLYTDTGKHMKAHVCEVGFGNYISDGMLAGLFTNGEYTSEKGFYLYCETNEGPGYYYGNLTFEITLAELLVIGS